MERAIVIGKLILYLHGYTWFSLFPVDRPFYSFNILRVVVDETQEGNPLEVTVDPYGGIPLEI